MWQAASEARGESTPSQTRLTPVTRRPRKPYRLLKPREAWTAEEHERFVEALQLYERDWKRIEEYIGTKSVVQIRSHAQKYFLKLQRSDQSAWIPPARRRRVRGARGVGSAEASDGGTVSSAGSQQATRPVDGSKRFLGDRVPGTGSSPSRGRTLGNGSELGPAGSRSGVAGLQAFEDIEDAAVLIPGTSPRTVRSGIAVDCRSAATVTVSDPGMLQVRNGTGPRGSKKQVTGKLLAAGSTAVDLSRIPSPGALAGLSAGLHNRSAGGTARASGAMLDAEHELRASALSRATSREVLWTRKARQGVESDFRAIYGFLGRLFESSNERDGGALFGDGVSADVVETARRRPSSRKLAKEVAQPRDGGPEPLSWRELFLELSPLERNIVRMLLNHLRPQSSGYPACGKRTSHLPRGTIPGGLFREHRL
ncbi:hypothetical protein F1559_002676 [Cyanidiococcus yangmingshanensis]|uniref:Uncharacterized protein n=1 Tax=Cyanidiococcus yangmingshanensis TaxID=2690220 RepID=A0A7J7II13_9RHOD|nr:hypothetical protein F1559_002676 [Cyanidiococcus yangmingshanensis]